VHLKRAVALRSDSREAHFQLARAYRTTHQTALADQEESMLRVEDQAKALDTQIVTLSTQALRALDQQSLPEAIASYRQILTLAPNDVKARYDLAVVYERLQDRKQERRLLEEAEHLNSSFAPVHSQLGFLEMVDGHNENAESQLKLALIDDPQCVEALGNLGVLYAQSSRFDEAAHLLTISVEDNPAYEKGYLNLGLVLAAQGQYNEAQTALKKALAIAPAEPSALQALERIRSHAQEAAQTDRE
jgi:protein O-GlcNAc transferase